MSISEHVTDLCMSVSHTQRHNYLQIPGLRHLSFCRSCTGTLMPWRLQLSFYRNTISTVHKNSKNKAPWLIHMKPKYSHATPLLTVLHWFPADQQITFKTALNMFKTVSNTFPSYNSDTLGLYFSKPKCEGLQSHLNLAILRSSWKFGDRAFELVAFSL